MVIYFQRVIVVVGTPGSGKDLLIRAIHDLGRQHAQIVPKHTSRPRWADDEEEMICPGDLDYNLDGCDITYKNYEDEYGIETRRIWEGLLDGAFQVVVVSNADAINELHSIFGDLLVLVYVHSEVDAEKYREMERSRDKRSSYVAYVERRVKEYRQAIDLYLNNFLAFDHVLIYSGIKKNMFVEEDLFDQLFRLFRAYERADIYLTRPKPVLSQRFWREVIAQGPPIILGDGEK
jgi:ribose 1,5-bisphosphokinase PhnN